MKYLPKVPDDAYVKVETTKILKQHKAYMAQFEEMLNDEKVRPLTDHVTVGAPEQVKYKIDFTYYTEEGGTLTVPEVEANVNAAVAEFKAWQGGRIGRDVNPSRLVQMLM